MDRIRVLRVVEYEGPREWVEVVVAEAIHGEKIVSAFRGTREEGKVIGQLTIRAATIGCYPEILKKPSNEG